MNVMALYITEAHAQDEWPISSSRCNQGMGVVSVNQPKAMEDRLAIARNFVELFDFADVPMWSDSMANEFESQFGAWPLRFYVISKQGVLTYAAMPEQCMFDLFEIRRAMEHELER